MGRVTQREGKLAGEVARNAASDIKKVVKLFDYISEEDLNEINKAGGEKKAPDQKAN